MCMKIHTRISSVRLSSSDENTEIASGISNMFILAKVENM